MPQSPLLTFTSTAFPIVPGEDEHTNPGIYGRSLAEWLAVRLRARGLAAGEAFAEDFGWCVPIDGAPRAVYIACANSEDRENEWLVFSFVEEGLVARLLGRASSAEALAQVFGHLKECLATASEVGEFQEEA